ncbi:MAG: hypothetical protein OXF79_16090 [Chloroflexi bacterium]|nr:hypothetical protein [Chloroflexota bacterium]
MSRNVKLTVIVRIACLLALASGAVVADDDVLIFQTSDDFDSQSEIERKKLSKSMGRKVIVEKFKIYTYLGVDHFLQKRRPYILLAEDDAPGEDQIFCALVGKQGESFARKPGKHIVKLEGTVAELAPRRGPSGHTLVINPCQFTILEQRRERSHQEHHTQTVCEQARVACSGLVGVCKSNIRFWKHQEPMCQRTARNFNPDFRTDNTILKNCLNSRNAAARACRVAQNCLRQRGCIESVQQE